MFSRYITFGSHHQRYWYLHPKNWMAHLSHGCYLAIRKKWHDLCAEKKSPSKYLFMEKKARCLSMCILCYYLWKRSNVIYFYVPVTLLSSLHIPIHLHLTTLSSTIIITIFYTDWLRVQVI